MAVLICCRLKKKNDLRSRIYTLSCLLDYSPRRHPSSDCSRNVPFVNVSDPNNLLLGSSYVKCKARWPETHSQEKGKGGMVVGSQPSCYFSVVKPATPKFGVCPTVVVYIETTQSVALSEREAIKYLLFLITNKRTERENIQPAAQ